MAARARLLEALELAEAVGDDAAINRVGGNLGTLALYEAATRRRSAATRRRSPSHGRGR